MKAKLRLVRDITPDAEIGDDVLVRRLVAREDAAASAAWRRYASLVRGLAMRVLGPRNEIEDLVQDVFASLFRRIDTLRDPSALRSFIVGITLREIRSELRRRHVRRWLRLTDSGELPDQPAGGTASDDEVFDRLHRALDTLEPRARIVFVLRHIEGFELTEVASAAGCSLATVKRVLAQSREKLAVIARRDPVLSPYFDAEEA